MPVRKFRDVSEMEDAVWRDNEDVTLLAAIRARVGFRGAHVCQTVSTGRSQTSMHRGRPTPARGMGRAEFPQVLAAARPDFRDVTLLSSSFQYLQNPSRHDLGFPRSQHPHAQFQDLRRAEAQLDRG